MCVCILGGDNMSEGLRMFQNELSLPELVPHLRFLHSFDVPSCEHDSHPMSGFPFDVNYGLKVTNGGHY